MIPTAIITATTVIVATRAIVARVVEIRARAIMKMQSNIKHDIV
jgi:hypothetical protein